MLLRAGPLSCFFSLSSFSLGRSFISLFIPVIPVSLPFTFSLSLPSFLLVFLPSCCFCSLGASLSFLFFSFLSFLFFFESSECVSRVTPSPCRVPRGGCHFFHVLRNSNSRLKRRSCSSLFFSSGGRFVVFLVFPLFVPSLPPFSFLLVLPCPRVTRKRVFLARKKGFSGGQLDKTKRRIGVVLFFLFRRWKTRSVRCRGRGYFLRRWFRDGRRSYGSYAHDAETIENRRREIDKRDKGTVSAKVQLPTPSWNVPLISFFVAPLEYYVPGWV